LSRIKHRRTNKLPYWNLQVKVILVFFVPALLCVLLQYLIGSTGVVELLMNRGDVLLEKDVARVELNTFIICAGLLTAMFMGTGLVVTLRIFGPIRRLESHLKDVAAGKNPGPCNIREGDEFQDLCVLINHTIETLQQYSLQGLQVKQPVKTGVQEPES